MSTIYILDLDGTIVGDVSDILEDYYFRQSYAQVSKNKRYLQTTKELCRKFTEGLIRPYFVDFCKYILSTPASYVYVYTASTNDWANYLIPQIEIYINQKLGHNHHAKTFAFQRPIFSREHCDKVTFKKALETIMPEIKARHKDGFHCVMVDNNVTLQGKETKFLLQCPTYDFATPIDFMRGIEWNPFAKKAKLLSEQNLPSSLSSVQKAQSESYIPRYYYEIYKRYKRVIKRNKKFVKDEFWKRFVTTIKTLHVENDVESMSSLEFPLSIKKQYLLELRRSTHSPKR